MHEHLADDAVSLGPFVLAGGEIAAMAIVDAVGRRLPGALGNAASLERESFSAEIGGGIEHPHYTRPAEFRGWGVPEVLRSGDHAAVERWREAHLGPPSGLMVCCASFFAQHRSTPMSVIESLEREQLRDDIPALQGRGQRARALSRHRGLRASGCRSSRAS